MERVVLAYSGGLDTTVMIPYLRERGFDVIAMAADVGQEEELEGIKEKALASGASKCYVVDCVEEFLTDFVWPTLRAGAVYEGRYYLGTAFARPVIAKHLVEVAKKEKASCVAHGATGKGNDQVRFELTVKALAPELKIVAPWREWEIRSRDEEMAYAEKRGLSVPPKESSYSRDRNIWHISHEGLELEDPASEPQERMWVLTENPQDAPEEPAYVEVEFEGGTPVGLDGERLKPVELLSRLNKLAGRHGVGRVDIVENRLVGMKSRGCYETPGGTVLHAAHADLESICLDRDTLHYKRLVAERYAELVYYGQWYCPLKEALDAFVDATQQTVSGVVRLKLYKGSCAPVGRSSPYSLYVEDLATFGADAVYNQKDAEGFINLFGLPIKVSALVRKRGGKRRD